MKELLIVKNINKKFKKQTAIDNISLSIEKGEIYGLVGNNGAGKTTLLKIMGGLLSPDSGNVVYYDKLNIGMLISSPKLYGDMTAFENLKAFALGAGYKISNEKLKDVLQEVGLSDTKKLVAKFSTGMKQRLGLALALIGKPDLLLLDEPINGLDIEGVVDLRNVILKIHKESETTIIVSSHILDELSKIATRICLIKNGKIVVDCSEQEFLEKGGGKSLEESYLKFMAQN